MKLSLRGMAIAGGALWGGALLTVSLARRADPDYAREFLSVIESVYPGFRRGRDLKHTLLAGLYGFVDGASAGLLLAWLYNLAGGDECSEPESPDTSIQ